MKKIAFVFPGQGAQYTGMGKDFYEQISVCKEVFEKASEVTGIDIASLCFEENSDLNVTEYTQIAMLAVEAAILKAVEERGIASEVNAGLSLGEYGALIASRVLSLEDAFKVIRQRGKFMQEAVPTGGAMAAVIGMEGEKIAQICDETEGIVSVANYNCPGQIVITGEAEAVAKAGETLKNSGARRVLLLNVSGPFHSAMLKDAGRKLADALKNVEIHPIETPYISNVTAEYVTETEQVADLLTSQISAPVKWQQSVEKMIENGINIFIEIGPGKTLTGFLKKINRSIQSFNIEKVEDLDTVAAALKE